MFDWLLYGQVHWLWVPIGAVVGLIASGLCCAARDWSDYRRDYYPSLEDAEQQYEPPKRVKN